MTKTIAEMWWRAQVLPVSPGMRIDIRVVAGNPRSHGRNHAPDAMMSCRASFHFVHQGLPPRWPGRRPWRRVLPMPVRALDRVVSVSEQVSGGRCAPVGEAGAAAGVSR